MTDKFNPGEQFERAIITSGLNPAQALIMRNAFNDEMGATIAEGRRQEMIDAFDTQRDGWIEEGRRKMKEEVLKKLDHVIWFGKKHVTEKDILAAIANIKE